MVIVIFNFPRVPKKWKILRPSEISLFTTQEVRFDTICSEIISMAFIVIFLSYIPLKLGGSLRASKRVLGCLVVFSCNQGQNVLFFICKCLT